MTPSLPAPPVAVSASAGHPEGGLNASQNQTDSDSSPSFDLLLGRASGVASGVAAAGPSAGPEEQALLAHLQSLPEDGKLLPLLQRVTEVAGAAGADPRQLLETMIARLEQGGGDGDRDAAAALQQLLDGFPAQVAAVAPQDTAAQASGRLLAQAVDQQSRVFDGMAADHGRSLPESGREQQSPGLTKLLEPLNQSPPEGGLRSAELLAALKRPASGLRPAPQSPQPGLDPLAPASSPNSLQATSSGTNGVPTLSLEVPLQQGNWDQALSDRIQWLMGQRLQGAQIKLNPANLGPMEVRIQVQHDQASVQFSSAHAAVREALEAALPRLRDMFEAAGVELLNVDVSGQSFAQQQGAPDGTSSPGWKAAVTGGDGEAETRLETSVDRRLMSGRLDLFA